MMSVAVAASCSGIKVVANFGNIQAYISGSSPICYYSKMIKHLSLIAVFLILPFAVPIFQLGFDIPTILTVISLLFAILAGFFIATATSNYLRLQTLISDENSNLMNIYHYVKIIDPKATETVSDAIDEYIIAGLDYDLLEFAQPTRKLLVKVIDAVEKVVPSNERGLALLQNLYSEKSNLFSTNQEMALTAKQIVSRRHWAILIILALLIALMVFGLRDGGYMTNIMVGLLVLAVSEILFLIHEVDSNSFLAYQLSYESPQDIFASIGKLPYYPAQAFKTYKKFKNLKKPYRVGYYKNKSDLEDKEIKIVS